ncbi:MAG TPA: hypothetical protein VHG91_21960 [Longimicrobium sp.]|nr:hypothetical protein [Longimicrobium sp.]
MEGEARVAGFLVLRRPETNRDAAGRGVLPSVAPCLGGRCYGGIDRMPWFDVEAALEIGPLPPEAAAAWAAVEAGDSDFSGVRLCPRLSDAAALLKVSNRKGAENELVAVRGALLDEIKGTVPVGSARIEWLGYDVISLGWWSLLSVLFRVPSAFPGWGPRINGAGLLPSADLGRELARAYRAAELRGEVEELPEPDCEIDVVRVGRIRTGRRGAAPDPDASTRGKTPNGRCTKILPSG